MPSRSTTRRSDAEPAAPAAARPRLLAAVLIAAAALQAAAIATRSLGNDEAIWLYAGRIWADDGAAPYASVVENKTPGIFVVSAAVHAVGGSWLLLRAIGAAHVLATAWLCGRIAARVLGERAGVVATAVAGFAAAAPAFDGVYAGCTESFMAAWATLAVALGSGVAVPGARPATRAVLAGLALGVAVGFKQIAVAGAAPVAAAVWWEHGALPRGRRAGLVGIAALATVAALALVSLPVLVAVPFRTYVDGAWGILLDPGTRPDGDGLATRLANLATLARMPVPALLAGGVACLVLGRHAPGGRAALVPLAVWMAADAAGALASGRAYEHQLRQMIPSLAVATGLAAAVAADRFRAGGRAATAAAVPVVVVALAAPWQIAREFRSRVHREVGARDARIAAWIRERTAPADRIFLPHANSNPVLLLSERRACCRWANSLFLGRPGARAEVEAVFRDAPPEAVALPGGTGDDLRAWTLGLMADRYEAPVPFEGWRLYRRR